MKSRLRTTKLLWIALACVALATSVLAAPTPALAAKVSSPGLYVPSAILVSGDGTVLWSKHSKSHRRVASTIKMLNALVVRDKANLDDVITVTRKTSSISNGAVGLKTGQKLTVRQLLNIMLVHSANDAAEALAIGIAGSEPKYVDMMNAKAKELGLKDTHAADPHGLGKKETSSARDLAVLARHVLADPVLRKIVHTTSVSVPRGNGRTERYGTTDQLLGAYRGMEGVKTGYTDPAGYCFVGAAKRNGIELIGVVLGADDSAGRFSQMRKLLNWGFARAKREKMVSRDETMGVVQIANGFSSTVTLHAEKALTMTVLNDGSAGFTTQVAVPASVHAPVCAGQELGAVEITRDGSVVASVPLVADCAVAVKPPQPSHTLASARGAGGSTPSLWQRIAQVWARLGHMLGV